MRKLIDHAYRAIPSALLVVVMGGLLACGGGSGGAGPAPPVTFVNFQPATIVLGQFDFQRPASNRGNPAPDANTLSGPGGATTAPLLYVADAGNSRILGFNTVPGTNGAPADFVVGQTSFILGGQGTTASSFAVPRDVTVADGKLFCVDMGNNRVLIWNTLPVSNVGADVVVGQTNLTSNGIGTTSTTLNLPMSVCVAGGRLIVGETFNSRVMIWNQIPTTNGAAADLVLGQDNFTSAGANRGQVNPSANTLNGPRGVWSDGTRLVVADSFNHRVLIWSTFPTVSGQAADIVLGQPDFNSAAAATGASGLSKPLGIESNSTQLFVADCDNNRVLIWNAWPGANHSPADVVLGQINFTNNMPNDVDQDGLTDAEPSATTLDIVGFSWLHLRDKLLFVGDFGNNRTLIFQGT